MAMKLKEKLIKNKNNLIALKETMDPQILRQLGSINQEIEFEWLRMFFIQGKEHMKAHVDYWLPRIEKLERYWQKIDRAINVCIHCLEDNQDLSFKPTRRTLDILLWLLRERKTLRVEYERRMRHSAYKVLEPKWQPIVARPCDENDPHALPHDLNNVISIVDHYLQNKMFV